MTSRTGLSARWWGAACGLLAAAAAMGIGQLFAGFTIPAASPVVAVGEAAIDHTPLAVKDWATSTFGTDDKTVLLAGVLVVVFLYSMLVGVLAMRRLALGFLGTGDLRGYRARGRADQARRVGVLRGADALRRRGGSDRAVLAGREGAAGRSRPGAAGRAARASSAADHDADRLPPIAFGQGDRDPRATAAAACEAGPAATMTSAGWRRAVALPPGSQGGPVRGGR